MSDKQRPFPAGLQLFDLDDKPADFVFGKGQPWRLVNIWALWCPPCVKELPSLKALQDKTKGLDKFKVVLISDDLPTKGESLRYKLKQRSMPAFDTLYTKMLGLGGALEMEGLPTTYLVSPEGQIIYTFLSDNDWNSSETQAFLKKTLPAGTFP